MYVDVVLFDILVKNADTCLMHITPYFQVLLQGWRNCPFDETGDIDAM